MFLSSPFHALPHPPAPRGAVLHSPSPFVSCALAPLLLCQHVQSLHIHHVSLVGNPSDSGGPISPSHDFVPAKAEGNPKRPSDGFVSAAEINSEEGIPSVPCEGFVSAAEIAWAAKRSGMALHMDAIGPFFRVRALDLHSKEVLGAAQGFVKVWTGGRILHLDSIRMNTPSLRAKKPLFGMVLLLGAAAVRHGYDRNCTKAELLAINDTEVYHSKLVRYYTRMGFRTVYHVTGESLQDIPHMLIWGGVGTRMDANIEELLLKWSPAFRKIRVEFCAQTGT